MINWSTLIKNMQTYIVIVSRSILNVSSVHLNGIWHLIWRYLSKPVLGRYPVLSGHYSIPKGCPLNTGFTVRQDSAVTYVQYWYHCERFELRSHFKSRFSLIVQVVDSDWRFDNLCGSHLQSQSELYTSVDGIILWLLLWLVNYVVMLLVVCQLSRDVIGYED